MTKTRKTACALVRVSSEEQVRGGYGLQFQEQDIRTFCERSNFNLIEVFRDEGYSGATANRPGFQKMMEWARERRFEVLVVWKLDRLFRDARLTLQTVDELASQGIEFRSVMEAFTHDSNGRFLLTIFAAGAEKERKDIAMRMSAGRVASARRGTWINGGVTPYGYRYNRKTKHLEIDKEEAPVVKQIFRWLVDERLSLFKIQSRLNGLQVPTKFDRIGRSKPSRSHCWWSKRTLGRMLRNEVYTGIFTFRKYKDLGAVHHEKNLRPKEDWIPVKTPPLVSRETFRRAQEQLKENAENSPRRTKTFYLLRKLLVCGNDGRRMQAARRRRAHGWQECKYYFCSGIRKGIAAQPCHSRTVSESRIAPPVWDKLRELLIDPRTVLKQLADYQDYKSRATEFADKKKTLEAQRRRADERKKRLIELYLGQAVDKEYFHSETRRLRDQIGQIDRELKKIDNLVITEAETKARTAQLQKLYTIYKARLSHPSKQVKREILTTFIKNVIVRGEELEIEVALPDGDHFAGQPSHGSSRKEAPSVFLKTRLLPVSEMFRNIGLHKNFKKAARHKHAT